MDGQNAKVSKQSAAGRERWSISAAALWRRRAMSIWEPECNDFQAFCGGQGGKGERRLKVEEEEAMDEWEG